MATQCKSIATSGECLILIIHNDFQRNTLQRHLNLKCAVGDEDDIIITPPCRAVEDGSCFTALLMNNFVFFCFVFNDTVILWN